MLINVNQSTEINGIKISVYSQQECDNLYIYINNITETIKYIHTHFLTIIN